MSCVYLTGPFIVCIIIDWSFDIQFLLGACIEGDVRLLEADGLSDFTDLSSDQDDLLRGRVEVCVGGNYSTVCNDGQWDNQDASVVCQQLGLSLYGESMNTLTDIAIKISASQPCSFKL